MSAPTRRAPASTGRTRSTADIFELHPPPWRRRTHGGAGESDPRRVGEIELDRNHAAVDAGRQGYFGGRCNREAAQIPPPAAHPNRRFEGRGSRDSLEHERSLVIGQLHDLEARAPTGRPDAQSAVELLEPPSADHRQRNPHSTLCPPPQDCNGITSHSQPPPNTMDRG